MNDPRKIAERVVGQVDWQSEVSGFCRCPGESLHTHRNGGKDCRVNVDGAPTIFCFHSSCIGAVTEANRRLRRELGGSDWQMALPGGRILRSGDVLQKDGTILQCGPAYAKASARQGGVWRQSDAERVEEKVLLETVRVMAERYRGEMFEAFRWPYAEIVRDSPLQVAERDAEDQFRTWLKLWPAHCQVWIGDVFSSGKPEHRTHFRPVAEWYQIGPVMGNFTCGSSFKPGSFSRSNENIGEHRFLVVESDTLSRDEVGAIFAYINRRLRFNLHAIVDTAGKSLHGWFDAPRHARTEAHLKAVLTVFGCDPKLFTYSQPVRVPGAYRDGRLQRIVWLKN